MKLALILALCVFTSWSQDLVVDGTGYGATQNEALTQAKRDALSRGIGQMLVGQTEMENYMIKKDLVLTKTLGNIKSFKVLKQEQGPDSAWEVKIQATVNKEGIRSDLAALMVLRETVGNPRLAVLIKETNMDNNDPTANKAEIKVIDFFKTKEFDVVDPSEALRFKESPEAVKALSGDPEAASKLGMELNAEVILVGNVVSKESDLSDMAAFQGTGMKSASATVSLKAINVTNRRLMAAKSVDAAAVHVNRYTAGNNAIEKSVDKLMSEKGGFFDALLQSWQSTANDGATFQLSILNVSSFQIAKAVKASLEKIGAKAEQRGFQKPRLSVDVQFLGKIDDFCEKIDGQKVGEGAKLSVEECSGSKAVLKVQ